MAKNELKKSATIARLRPSRPCPICGKPSAQAFHPFCSVRCSHVDLNHWLTGSYAIPGPALIEEDAAESQPDIEDEDLD